MKLAQLEMVDGRLKYVGDLVSGMPVLYYFEQVKAWTRDPIPEGLNLPIYYENAGNIEETLEWVGGTWVGAEEDVSNNPEIDNQYQLEQKLRFVSAELSKYQDYIDLSIALPEEDLAYINALKLYRINLNKMTEAPDWPSQANWPEVPTKN